LNDPEQVRDERLLIEAAQADPRQFARLYEANFDRVYAYIVRRVGNRHEAEDLTAEVFHQALTGIARFEWRGVPFAAWLFRIAANAIADRWKALGRPQPDSISDEAVPQEIERRAILFQLVDTLPVDQRRVIIRRFVEQRSIREIAGEFGKSEGAIKQLQFRALENLRERMGDTNG